MVLSSVLSLCGSDLDNFQALVTKHSAAPGFDAAARYERINVMRYVIGVLSDFPAIMVMQSRGPSAWMKEEVHKRINLEFYEAVLAMGEYVSASPKMVNLSIAWLIAMELCEDYAKEGEMGQQGAEEP